MLHQIQLLYAVEARLRSVKAGPALRQTLRGSETRMILECIGRALKMQQENHLPRGATGKAISYTLKLWTSLCEVVESGTFEIDNNLVENAIRPTAIGKKNYLFFGSAEAGQTSAIIYSLMETCRMLRIDQRAYFTDVLSRLPTAKNSELADLTPARWDAAINPAQNVG